MKILFADTEFNGWEENRTHLEQYTKISIEHYYKFNRNTYKKDITFYS